MTDVFKQEETPSDSILDQLVGEGKKFQTPEELAKGKLESDKFIQQLTTEQEALRNEMESLREAATKASTLQEVLDKLKPDTDSEKDGGNQPALNSDELTKLVREQIESTQQESARKSNREKASDQLLQKFGNDEAKAREFVKEEASKLGMSADDLGKMAETSPEAYARLLGLDKLKEQSTDTAGSLERVNSQALEYTNTGNRDVDFYRNLRLKNSKEFWKPGVQQEIYKLANGDPEVVQKILN